mgnify:CR=1 FL=1
MEKKYTKEERHEIYVKAYEKLDMSKPYICHAIADSTGLHYKYLEEQFPELLFIAPINHKIGDAFPVDELSASEYYDMKLTLIAFMIAMTE